MCRRRLTCRCAEKPGGIRRGGQPRSRGCRRAFEEVSADGPRTTERALKKAVRDGRDAICPACRPALTRSRRSSAGSWRRRDCERVEHFTLPRTEVRGACGAMIVTFSRLVARRLLERTNRHRNHGRSTAAASSERSDAARFSRPIVWPRGRAGISTFAMSRCVW